MTNKLVVEVVAPIIESKEFKNTHDASKIDMCRAVRVAVKANGKIGYCQIERGYNWKKSKPEYDIDYTGQICSVIDAAEELKTKIDDSAVIAEYERAYAVTLPLYEDQRLKLKMDKWLNHPVRLFQAYADQNTSHQFIMDPDFTQDKFLKDQTDCSNERTYLVVTYGSRKWQYRVGWDSYRTDNTGKAGKLTLKARSFSEKGKEHDDSYDESRFCNKSKYSKKPGEIIRYMEEDIENVKNRLDEKIKEEAKEMARVAQINAQWKIEGSVIECVEESGFSVVMDKKKTTKSSWDTTAKKVDVEILGGKKGFKISNIEAEFTKDQINEIINIVKKAKVTTY